MRLFPEMECEVDRESDIVFTPSEIAADVVGWFEPTGRILDPCRGGGVFADLMPGCDWCEIRDGRDFFDWQERVDWIVSNPPYSIFLKWLNHSMRIADDIVYVIPLFKVWQSALVIDAVRRWGGIVETRVLGSGRRIGFPFGFSCGAVHFRRAHTGDMRLSFRDA